MYNGVLVIRKEQDFTSADVVAKLRGICRQKKVGHTGTLDPNAEGVLPVCLGIGTGLCEYLTGGKKEYVAELLLGKESDTQDIWGEILFENEKSAALVTEAQVRDALMSMVGDQLQVPPMYSAKKVDGKHLYELAREGKVIERKPVPVTVYEVEILEMHLPVVKFRVQCSKGTYIRTICHDVGKKLGCGAIMQSLLRTSSCGLSLEQAITLQEAENLAKAGRLTEKIISVETVLSDYPVLHALPDADKLLKNGNPLPYRLARPDDQNKKTEDRSIFRIYNSEGLFYGLYEFRKDKNTWHPVKMFLPEQSV